MAVLTCKRQQDSNSEGGCQIKVFLLRSNLNTDLLVLIKLKFQFLNFSIYFNIYLCITYFIWFMTNYTMMWTCVPRKVRRNPKLRGVRRSPELFARSTDFRVPETLIFPAKSTCLQEALVLIKVVPVKNDYFLRSKFELYRYQQINGFLYWLRFYWKKCGACISHKLIVRLIPTWIWYDLLTVSRIWPLNHQLSYYQFKVA